jgi:hypothetical protein
MDAVMDLLTNISTLFHKFADDSSWDMVNESQTSRSIAHLHFAFL